MSQVSYAKSGVDLKVSADAKNRMQEIVARSHTPQVLNGIGLFSGFYSLDTSTYTEPVLTSSMDGVGTKVKVAQMMGVYDTIGQDLVNHCVNDIMVCGADPLFFMDYIAADKLQVDAITEIVRGLSEACRASGCSLIGGETAEMPGVYVPNHFDLAGCIVGMVDRGSIIDGSRIVVGDVIVGLTSSGLHTNGYSLVRKIFFELKNYDVATWVSDLGAPLGEELLRIHKSYRSVIKAVRWLEDLHGIAHITGGGIIDNIKRLLPKGLDVRIDWSSWSLPPIFRLIQSEGDVSNVEMRRVFNLGIGMTMIVKRQAAEKVIEVCESVGETALAVGEITMV